MTDSAALLSVEHLTMRFGGLVAVDDLSFDAVGGDITAIIGPNGAGKTTVFNCLTGFYPPSVGRLTVKRSDRSFQLEQMEGYRIARDAGVARTFQNLRLFPQMSVLENLIVAQHKDLMRASMFSIAGLLGLPTYKRAEDEALDLARRWLDRIGLRNQADWDAGNLSYGDQRRLEIARSMCTRPVLLCLDEPAAGLTDSETELTAELLIELKKDHTLIVIEHDMDFVRMLDSFVTVLNESIDELYG